MEAALVLVEKRTCLREVCCWCIKHCLYHSEFVAMRGIAVEMIIEGLRYK